MFRQWIYFELYIRTCPAMFLSSLYFLITFLVLHKSRISRLTSDLLTFSVEGILNFFKK